MLGSVLVVDDSADNRAFAAATLADEGVAVTMATTGEEGLAAFATTRFDAVLLDIYLPEMDGITVCEHIRKLPNGEGVAIVFVTARRDVETFDRALRAGGDDFLTKPFRPGELLLRLEAARRLRELSTERGALFLELKRQRDELQRVQLQNEQLTEFLVHDLKNPVSSIELLAQRVMRGADSVTGKKIREETRSLMRMITNLLDLNKAQDGRLVAARHEVDLQGLVATAFGELTTRAMASKVEMVAQIDLEEPVTLDRDLVLRVLTNLLENAMRHAPEDSRIVVSAKRLGGVVEVRVADSGIGVPLEQRSTVFDRFVTAGSRQNHGLGLAYCRVAIAAQGGRIWVEDNGPGAVFCIEIPDAR
jgi:two-component system sensor histidine kinase/response regulator